MKAQRYKEYTKGALLCIGCGSIVGAVIFFFKLLAHELEHISKGIYENNGKIHSDITVEVNGGEVSKYSVRSKIGENFFIIGLPNTVFDKSSPLSETVIMIVPRLIRTMKTTNKLENNL